MEEVFVAVAIALGLFITAVVIKAAINLPTESSFITLEKELDFGVIYNGFGCADFGGLSPPMEATGLFIFNQKFKEQGLSPETGMTNYG